MYKSVPSGLDVLLSTFVTGDTPSQKYGILGGREDFERDIGWNGCLDAVEYIPQGDVSVVQSEFTIVPRSMPRSRSFA